MSKISGHGGIVVKAGTPNVIVHNSNVDIDHEGVIDDVTTSGSDGSAEGLGILTKVNSVTIEMPDDDAHAADIANALGLTPLSVVDLYFKRGAAASYNKVSNTIVRNVGRRNPQTGARRYTITCEYGTLTYGVSAPSLS